MDVSIMYNCKMLILKLVLFICTIDQVHLLIVHFALLNLSKTIVQNAPDLSSLLLLMKTHLVLAEVAPRFRLHGN